MGLFDFIENAGKKIGGIADLAVEIEKTGTDIEDLKFDMEDGKVKISGKTMTQEAREKIILAVGNINGIGQVEDSIGVENSDQESTFYTVKSGDSLSKISKKVYGDPMKYNAIFEANKPMLKSVDKIYPGQVLRIPAL